MLTIMKPIRVLYCKTMNNPIDIEQVFKNHKLYCGQMISGSKQSPKGHVCVWNANIITRKLGKIWYGDLDLTKSESVLKEIALEIGEPIYVLREMDCRFGTERDSVEILISKAVWSSDKGFSKEYRENYLIP
jgi:hypothetical protein